VLDFSRVFQGLRGRPGAGGLEAEPAPAEVPLRTFGPDVALYADRFVVAGRAYPRRQFPPGEALQPIAASRRRRLDWDSQLAHLPAPAGLAAEVPSEGEIFAYLSPTMARVLDRIAAVDGALGFRGFVLLVGPTGCGKTTLAKTYCYLANQPCAELSFSGDTTLTDFYTSVEVVRVGDGQSTVTVPGPAVEAMLRGKKLLLNELNMLSPDILSVFTQAMDTGCLVISGTERGNVEIEVHPQFGILGTANPSYVGTLQLGRAMERRFGRGLGYVEMSFLPPEEEAVAVERELAATYPFREEGISFDPTLVRRGADLAHRLRHDPQIGEAVGSRLSTRALIHWLGLAQITGLSLREVAEGALLTMAPAEARAKAVELIAGELHDLGPDPAATDRLRRYRIAWPEPDSGQALPVGQVPARPTARRSGGEVVIHRVRYQQVLPDGGRVLVGEPIYRRGDRRVGLGMRLRVYGPDGKQVVDPERVTEVGALLRETYGLNVPGRIGRRPRLTELLPCLTPTTLRYLKLAEAALLLGRPVFLAGPTGCGKSSLARTLAYLRGGRMVEFSFTGETAKADLSASRRLVGGVTHWTIQAFLEALGRGDTVIVNEYNLAYPDVHSLVNSLFDKGARLSLPDGSVHRVHPDARVIATGYLEGPGVKPLNEGVENRFGAIVAMDYPPVEEEVAVLAALGPALSRPTLENCVRLVDYCRRLTSGRVEPTSVASLPRASQEALRQAARRAALSTAELVALARSSQDDAEFLRLLRIGALEGASESVRRVLEPVLLQYDVGG